MTSTTVGLPDRYRPLEQVGPEERTPTGVIASWHRSNVEQISKGVSLVAAQMYALVDVPQTDSEYGPQDMRGFHFMTWVVPSVLRQVSV